jgi:hypothetical protein
MSFNKRIDESHCHHHLGTGQFCQLPTFSSAVSLALSSPQITTYLFSVSTVAPFQDCDKWNHTIFNLTETGFLMQLNVSIIHPSCGTHPFLLNNITVYG